MLKELPLKAEAGKFLCVRKSLDARGDVRNEWPMGQHDSPEGALTEAASINDGCSRDVDRDIAEVYNDQGGWVGGWSANK